MAANVVLNSLLNISGDKLEQLWISHAKHGCVGIFYDRSDRHYPSTPVSFYIHFLSY